MPTPDTSGQASAFSEAQTGYPRIRHLERLMEDTFQESPVGVVQIDLHFNFIYANKKAMEIFGITAWENLSIHDLVPNRETINLLEEKLSNRQRGISEEYEAEVVRQSDGRHIPIKITAMPAINDDGTISGAISLIRSLELERASQAIDRCVQTAKDSHSLLRDIAEQTNRAIPFDACTVSLYSRDMNFSRVLFSDDPALLDLYATRWFRISAAQRLWGQQKTIVIVPDVDDFLTNVESDYQQQSIEILRELEWRSFIRYPVVREDKVIGAFALARKIKNGYTEEDKKRLEALPLDTALATVLHFQEVRELQFRLDLVQDVLRCGTNESIFNMLVTKLSGHYDWQCIHIFSVTEEKLKLEAQHAKLAALRLPGEYEQHIDKGILGFVRKHRKPLNVSNILTDPQVSKLAIRINEATVSELAIPITVGGEVRAILNIEDNRANAFAPEEMDALVLILKEVEGVLDRFRSERLISASYAATPSAVWVIDRRGRIKRANPSAQKLLDFSEEQMVGTFIADYFEDRELGKALVRSPEPVTTEIILVDRAKHRVSVLLGGSPLNDEFAGERVISGRDLRGHKRTEQIEFLDQLFYEIATQVKTPLLLASDWVRRFRDHPNDRPSLDLADKVLRQLQKAEIAYDRLALFNRSGGTIPYHPVLVDFPELLRDCVAEFPESETRLVKMEFPAESLPHIVGDLYQLGFVIKSTLSYLFRFSTQNASIHIRAKGSAESIELTMSGPKGSMADSGPHRRKCDAALMRTLAEMALGKSVINKFVSNHGGVAHEPLIESSLVTFCYELPTGRSVRR
jgi:PAS domain S-box-containing protein